MVNKLKNDKGNYVAAVGSKGSKARAACEHPALIEKYVRRHYESTIFLKDTYRLDDAHNHLKNEDNIFSLDERNAILMNTNIS